MMRNTMFALGLSVACCCPQPEPEMPPPAPPPAPAPAPAPAAPAAMAPAPAPVSEAKQRSDVASWAQLSISDEIKKKCMMADDDAYFAFDSANLTPRDHRVMQQLADCFEKGPMQGQKMSLVGHADPRGTDDYNIKLGQERADNVKKFLVQKGMADTRIQTSSRGKMDAKGYDEPSWAQDRRVDVQ